MADITITIGAQSAIGGVPNEIAKQVKKSMGDSILKTFIRIDKAAGKLTGRLVTVFSNSFKRIGRVLKSFQFQIVALAGAGGFGALITSTARTDTALKSLAATMKISDNAARKIVISLVDASQGLLSFQQATELANKAIALGFIKLQDLGTAV